MSSLHGDDATTSPNAATSTTAKRRKLIELDVVDPKEDNTIPPCTMPRTESLLPPPQPLTASVADWSLLHQVTSLHWGYCSSTTSTGEHERPAQWICHGVTTLYLIGNSNNTSAADEISTTKMQELALHLRCSAQVDSVQVQQASTTASDNEKGLVNVPVHSFHHVDPLFHVLVHPFPDENTNNTNNQQYQFDADAQSSRGATGMTNGLRAASVASNLGELRVFWEQSTSSTTNHNHGSTVWRHDLEQQFTHNGNLAHSANEQLAARATARREARLNLVAQHLGRAGAEASKVTVHYHLLCTPPPLDNDNHHHDSVLHRAGWHAIASPHTPHVYTTTGVYGDHEGPRTWIPCLDSAAVAHRATHQLQIFVTAPVRLGLSVVGCGEDFGTTQTILHNDESDREALQYEIGKRQYQRIFVEGGFLNVHQSLPQPPLAHPHVIPPDHSNHPKMVSLDSILATTVWCSQTWTPIPVRSLGFAIGPFKVLEDPEYFGPALQDAMKDRNDGDDDDENDDDGYDTDDKERSSNSSTSRLEAALAQARAQGEGIRQVYFMPLWERPHVYTRPEATAVGWHLLPQITLQLRPMTHRQRVWSKQLDQAVLLGTVGVPHRALSMMRDVLALPVYRTVAYTQIWIPNAVHGGNTSGAWADCPEVQLNVFLGGAILDSRLLPPMPASRLPYFQGGGGRALQFQQARCAIRGWITAALPLGGHDDVGNGYLLTLVESLITSLYERGHGGWGEGGSRGSMFYSLRYAQSSGLNSPNLDFLPVQNMEEIDGIFLGGVGAVPVEDRHNEQLWRGANNGSESHTSAMDEFNTRQLLIRDVVEALERRTVKDRGVPTPSMGWFGSHLSLTFLSSNATSSSDLGCGAVELLHSVGGLVYRTLKCELFRSVVEGRAGVANFIRLVRAAFIAAHLEDLGEAELLLPKQQRSGISKNKQSETTSRAATKENEHTSDVPLDEMALPSLSQSKQPFVVCVNEILKKKGLTHTLFTRALQNLSGRIKEPQLLGTLVDVDRLATDPRTQRPFVEPEGFPNSYVRGASLLYCRVGVQVEAARTDATAISNKGIQMQAYAEPIIPEGGIAYGGPITIRVVENEGSFREYVKDLLADGSRRDWGTMFLHAKPVTTVKAQTAASGTVETSSQSKDAPSKSSTDAKKSTMGSPATSNAFTDADFHMGGYQAIELVRLTNLTPLLWVRVDPMNLYGGRISVFQPDACLAEQLFHDGDAGAQIDAIRALAERPLRIQGSVKVKVIYDVPVSELPVRLLGDCLRGSPALHSSLPHTPAVRAQAALAIAQWQNNKAPASKNAVGSEVWVGINILIQYFRERFYSSSVVMPTKFTRLALKKSEADVHKTAAATEGGVPSSQPTYDDTYVYLDTLDESERKEALKDAESIELEEDEEYRVRSAVVTAIACVRAQDGLTPPLAIQFLESVLESEDAEMVTSLTFSHEDSLFEEHFNKLRAAVATNPSDSDDEASQFKILKAPSSYVSSMLVADALLALCHVNAMPDTITDPATGMTVQSSAPHPLSRLINAARSWLDWELYREMIRLELAKKSQSGVSENCYDIIAPSAIFALANLAIAKQSTTDTTRSADLSEDEKFVEIASAKFYIDIFDCIPVRNDLTRAAAAQALCCIYCASDRFEKEGEQPLGLLSCLNFCLERINDNGTSVGLRHTLASVMMDMCSGKVCSMQRVAALAGRNDLVQSMTRLYNGPLGACHGGDNGSAVLTAVFASSFPSAAAVNDGARRGMRVVTRAGHPKETSFDHSTVVRVARFATGLWRTINGECPELPSASSGVSPELGVCGFDGTLRLSLLALWQLLWPRGCSAILQVQSWRQHESTQRYLNMGAQYVMQTSEKEKAAVSQEENSLAEINRLVEIEKDRQLWRGEMARKSYDIKATKGSTTVDVAAAEQGIGQPLPPILRDEAFKQGGWIASAAQQRRSMALDGGINVTKIRLTVKKDD